MRIELNILNSEIKTNSELSDNCTWYSRRKTYECDYMDDDIKNSTISHKLDRIVLTDIQITTQKSIDDLIEFLEIAKKSFKF